MFVTIIARKRNHNPKNSLGVFGLPDHRRWDPFQTPCQTYCLLVNSTAEFSTRHAYGPIVTSSKRGRQLGFGENVSMKTLTHYQRKYSCSLFADFLGYIGSHSDDFLCGTSFRDITDISKGQGPRKSSFLTFTSITCNLNGRKYKDVTV